MKKMIVVISVLSLCLILLASAFIWYAVWNRTYSFEELAGTGAPVVKAVAERDTGPDTDSIEVELNAVQLKILNSELRMVRFRDLRFYEKSVPEGSYFSFSVTFSAGKSASVCFAEHYCTIREGEKTKFYFCFNPISASEILTLNEAE